MAAEPIAARNRELAAELAGTMGSSAFGGVHVYGPNRSGRRNLALASIDRLQVELGGAPPRPFLDLEIRSSPPELRGFLQRLSRRLGGEVAKLPDIAAEVLELVAAIATESELDLSVEYLRDALRALPPHLRPIFGFFDLQSLASSHAQLDELFGMMRDALNQDGVFTFTTANEDQVRSCSGASWFTNSFQLARPYPVTHADVVVALRAMPALSAAATEPDADQVAEALLRHWGLGESCVRRGLERWQGIRRTAGVDFDERLETAAQAALAKQADEELRDLEPACREALRCADAGLPLSSVQRGLLERNPWSLFHLRLLPNPALGPGLEVLGAPLRSAVRRDLLRSAAHQQIPIEQELERIEQSLREGNPDVAHALAQQLLATNPADEGQRRRASLLANLADAAALYLARDLEKCGQKLREILKHLPQAAPFLEQLRVAQLMAVQNDWSKAPPERIRCAMVFEFARARRLERLARMTESFEADCRVADACMSKLLSILRATGVEPDDAIEVYKRDLPLLVRRKDQSDPICALPSEVHGLSETVLVIRALDPWWRSFDLAQLEPALARRNATSHRLAYATEAECGAIRRIAQKALSRLMEQALLAPLTEGDAEGEILPACLIDEVLRSPPPVA